MGLLNQFVSAAVRQIGRDGGKIISNKIYGNSPNLTNTKAYNFGSTTYSYAEQGLEEGDFVYSGTIFFKLQFGHWLWFIFFVPLPFVGLIGSIVFAYKTFFVKHCQYSTPLICKTIHIKDGRYREGFRAITILTPDNLNQEILQIEIPNSNKIYAILSTTLCAVVAVLFSMALNDAK